MSQINQEPLVVGALNVTVNQTFLTDYQTKIIGAIYQFSDAHDSWLHQKLTFSGCVT